MKNFTCNYIHCVSFHSVPNDTFHGGCFIAPSTTMPVFTPRFSRKRKRRKFLKEFLLGNFSKRLVSAMRWRPPKPVFARASEFLVVSHALVVVARIEIAKKKTKKNSRDAVSDVRKWCAPQSVS